MAKIPIEITIPVGQYANIKPTIAVDVPDGLEGKELVKYLWDEFHNLFESSGDAQNKSVKTFSGKKGIQITPPPEALKKG